MIFSDEVWLIILENLSIPELVKLRLVSHCFKELAEYVLKRHPGWEDLAKKNMQIEWLEDVMVKACPYDLISHQNEIHDPALWRKTYLSYINWQKILVKADVTFNKVPPSNFGYIVYTTTFDKYLLLVFGNNVIEIYTFVDDDPFRLLFKFQMNNYVPQAEFWQSNGDLLVVFQDRDSNLTFWDINKKIKITNNGCSSTRISRNGCRDFCIGENNGIITSFERDGNIISPGQSINLKLTEDQEVLIHTVHTNYLSILVYVHNAVILYNYKVMINNGMVAGFQFIDTTGPMRLIHPLNKWANFTILNTDYLYVTNDFNGFATNYHLEDHDLIHFYTPSRWGNVMSAAMHAHLVILGCQNGSIRLFSIEDTSEMMALYGDPANILYSRNIRTIKASNRPIFYLNFWEFEDKIFIVAVTDESIRLIKFV
ncbi:GSCOCG00001579001-RA-CDS [Cotesia congregata]|uniref:F-box domain-containing protein n=1 Tax=Cotesia congregata TaxID=51543 RepID=A0A8J2HM42_COTCN|nr:GSCOCG00001579001-RA-CDS [Cotesia congregata]CAG5106798.1 Protein of unknown function [Cotesia congregata]